MAVAVAAVVAFMVAFMVAFERVLNVFIKNSRTATAHKRRCYAVFFTVSIHEKTSPHVSLET